MLLQKFRENHSYSDDFRIDSGTVPHLSIRLNDQGNYIDRNPIEKWFYTLKKRINCFDNSLIGSRTGVRVLSKLNTTREV